MPRIAAVAADLLDYQLLPEDGLAEAMADLFGVRLVAATIARMSRTCAGRAQGFADTVGALVKAAGVKHLDETGFRIGGRTQPAVHRVHRAAIFYRISPRRAAAVDVMGIVVMTTGNPTTRWKGCGMPCGCPSPARTPGAGRHREEEWA